MLSPLFREASVQTPTWVAIAGAVGTWVIAIAAIWGEKIRSMLFKPDLRLDLKSPAGQFCTLNDGTEARYYHLRATSSKAYPVPRDVWVVITAIDRVGPDGHPQRVFSDEVPLGWCNRELHPIRRTIGPKTQADVDLLFVREGVMKFMPLFPTTNFPATHSGETHLWVTAVAQGLDGESKPLHLKIDWDGKWERGDTEMARHLRVVPVNEVGTSK
jgi:hypothetical protein